MDNSVRAAVLSFQSYYKLREYINVVDENEGVSRIILFEDNDNILNFFKVLISQFRNNKLPFDHVPEFKGGYKLMEALNPDPSDVLVTVRLNKGLDYSFLKIKKLFKALSVAIKNIGTENESRKQLEQVSIEAKLVKEMHIILLIYFLSIGIILPEYKQQFIDALYISNTHLEIVMDKCENKIMKGLCVCDFNKTKDTQLTDTESDPDPERLADTFQRKMSFSKKTKSMVSAIKSFVSSYMPVKDPYGLKVLLGIALFISKPLPGTIERTRTLRKQKRDK
ncbi:hypothetical protein EBZ38_02165 [bacterium]|nr:hypothetical protein [bacterium]